MRTFNHAQRMRIREMANTMRELGDDCTVERLIRRGFTRAEIDALGETATEHANAAANRRAA
jgi:ATP-dependent RNA circularization protein (DNA/RNA ligase family)